ncbi:uncharacterized protein LOC134780061 isoform X2 [Penaeus indicus]
MCNVCLKKFISRPASLAHVATHIICNFEPKAVLIHVDRDGQILPNQVTGLETLERNQHSRIRRNSFEDDNDEEMEAEEEEGEEEEEEEENNNNEEEDVDVERVDDGEEDNNEVDKVHISNKSQFRREGKTVEQSSIVGRRKNRKGVARKIKPESVVYETENETLLRLQGASCSSSEDEKEVRKIHSSKTISPVKIEKGDSSHVSSYSKVKKQGKVNTSEGKKIKTVTSSKENKTMNIKQQKVVLNQYLSKTELAGRNKSKENSPKTDLTVQPSTSTYEGSATNSSTKKPELKSTDYSRNQSSPLRASWKDHSEEEVHKVATQLRLFEEDWSRSESSTSDSEGEEDQLDERNSNEGGENSEPEQGSSLEIDVVPSMRAKSKCTYEVKNIDNLLERSQDAIDIICEKNYLAESRLNREKVIPVPPLGETCLPGPRNASEDQGSECIRSPAQEEEEVMPRLTAIWANEKDSMSEKDILSKGKSKETGDPSYSLSQPETTEFKVKAEEEKEKVEEEPSTVVEELHKKMVTKPGCQLDREEGTNKDKITIKEEITLKEEPLIDEDQVELFQVRVMVSEEDIKKEDESESPKKKEGTGMETVVISDDADVAERPMASSGGWNLLGFDLPVDEVRVEDVKDEIEKQVDDGESVTGLGSSCRVPASIVQTTVTSMTSRANATKLASAPVLHSKAYNLCEKSDGTSKPQTETPKVKDDTSSQVKAPEMSGKSEKLAVSTSTDRKPFKTVTLVRPKHISASGSRSNVPFFSKCRNTFPASKTSESEVASASREVCSDSVSLPSTSSELTSPLIASNSQTKPCPAPAISPILAKNPEIDKVCKPPETFATSTKSSKSHQDENKTESKTKLAGDSPYTKMDSASGEQIQVSSGCPQQLKMQKEATSPTSPCTIAHSISTLQTHVTSTPIQVTLTSAASGWEKKSDKVSVTPSVSSLFIQQMSEEKSYKPNLDIKTRSVQNVSGPRKSGLITISKVTKNVSPSTEAENVKGTELQAHFSGSDTQDKPGKSVSRCSLQADSLAQKILTVKSAELVVSRKGKDIVVTRKSNLESLQTTEDKMYKRKQEEQLDSETTQAAGEKLTESESEGRHDAESLSQERDRDSLKLKIKDLAPEECVAVKTLVGISERTTKMDSVSSSIGESHLTLEKPLDHRKTKLREESHSDASPSCSMPHRDIQTSVLKEEEGNKVSSEADVSKLPALVKNASKVKVQDVGNKSENISISWTRQRPEEKIKQYGGKMKEDNMKYRKRIRQNQDERQNVLLGKSKEEGSARGKEIDLPVVAGEDAGVDLVQPHKFKLIGMKEEEEHPLDCEEMFRKIRHKEKKKDQNKKLWQMVMAAKARAKKEVEKKDSDTPSDGAQVMAGDAGVSAEELTKDHVLTLWSGESKETSTKRERGSADHQGSELEEKPFYVKRAKITQCAGEENKADEIRKVVPGLDQLKSSSANTPCRVPDDAGMSSSERTLIPKETEVVSLESEVSESLDPVSAAEVDLMTTLDQNAVMRDATTFGDLSYDYDLQ